MNKNTKKFVVTLLSVLMVLSFMPTIAFAAIDPSPEEKAEGHTFDDDHVEWTIEPTCETPGVGIASCTKKENGVDCKATKNVYKAALGHNRVYEDGQIKTIVVTAEEYAKEMLKQGYSEEYVDWWLENYGKEICTGTVGICENCGAYMSTGPGAYYDHELSDPYSFWRYASTTHVAPEGLKPCDATFTCTKCGKKDVSNNDYNEDESDAYHANKAHWVLKESYKAHEINGVGSVVVDKYVCDKCNAVVHMDRTYYDADGNETTALGPNNFASMHKTEAIVEKIADCEHNGRVVNICTKCGEEISAEETPKLNHSWKEATSPATETDYAYKYEYCENCEAYKSESGAATYDWDLAKKEKVGVPISHNVKVTKLLPKNCADDTWLYVECTNPGCSAYDTIVSDADQTGVEKVGDKYYYNFDGIRTELTGFEVAEGHKWGEAKVIAEATCEKKAIEGRVCDTCGAFYHTTIREIGEPLGHEPVVKTVEATCGEEGYTYSVCSRCDEYLNKDGKTAPGPYEWDEVPPVVGYGAECQYEWTVTKEATATETGEQALVCKVCGHVKEGSRTVIPIDADKAKQAAADEAKPVIEAASAIISDMDKYTDDSVIAIIAAEANLNQAITSGSAADVKKATAELQAAVNAAQEKAASKMTAKGKTVKVKYKKSKTFKANKAFTVKNAAGKVTYKKANKKGGAKIKVASNGKVTVKKGLKKGTYKVKVKITDAGSGTVLGKAKTVTLKVKITK